MAADGDSGGLTDASDDVVRGRSVWTKSAQEGSGREAHLFEAWI